MRRLIAVLLVVIALLSGCARAGGGEGPGLVGDYACSAWLPYWDADAALEEARAFSDRYESLICFEAFFDEDGNWLLPPESQQILDGLRTFWKRVCSLPTPAGSTSGRSSSWSARPGSRGWRSTTKTSKRTPSSGPALPRSSESCMRRSAKTASACVS